MVEVIWVWLWMWVGIGSEGVEGGSGNEDLDVDDEVATDDDELPITDAVRRDYDGYRGEDGDVFYDERAEEERRREEAKQDVIMQQA